MVGEVPLITFEVPLKINFEGQSGNAIVSFFSYITIVIKSSIDTRICKQR